MEDSGQHGVDQKVSLNGCMSCILTEIVIESTDPTGAAAFWSEALGWKLREYQPGNVPWMSASGDADQHDLKLVFVQARDERAQGNRLYFNPSGCQLSDEVERLRGLGATLAATTRAAGTQPETPWVALVDPGGTGFTLLPSLVD